MNPKFHSEEARARMQQGHRASMQTNEQTGAPRRNKLTEDQVREIRRRYAAQEANMTQLAREYGVTVSQISLISRRLSWAHVV